MLWYIWMISQLCNAWIQISLLVKTITFKGSFSIMNWCKWIFKFIFWEDLKSQVIHFPDFLPSWIDTKCFFKLPERKTHIWMVSFLHELNLQGFLQVKTLIAQMAFKGFICLMNRRNSWVVLVYQLFFDVFRNCWIIFQQYKNTDIADHKTTTK